MHCRDLKSVRACLTYFKRIEEGHILDFRPLVFIDPGAMVLMHHLARVAKRPTLSIFLPKRVAVEQLMNDHLQASKKEFKLRSPNAFPLRYVESEGAMIERLSAWRDMLRQTGACDEETARSYSATMTEVLQNSFTHGKTKGACIVAGQTFPRKKHSMLVAVDNGIGIPESLKKSNRYNDRGLDSDWQWIVLSLERGVTAKTRPSNFGLGLYTLRETIRANGGSLLVISGKGAVVVGPKGTAGTELGDKYGTFSGTLLILDIKAA